jgi:DNA-binding NarL/FixJ family response regulator
MIKVVLADYQTLVRKGIKALLKDAKNIQIVGEATSGREVLDKVKLLHPDILILEICLPDMNGLEVTRQLGTLPRSLILTSLDQEEYVFQAIESGVSGYLLKDSSEEELVKAIHTVGAGNRYFSGSISNVLVNGYLDNYNRLEKLRKFKDYSLTKRENQILRLIIEGMKNKDIASKLKKSIRTIETHRFNIMKKFKVSSTKELIDKVQSEYFVEEMEDK